MSFPVLICGDSSLARKMVRKSLPEPFTEHVYTAENGHEALQTIKEKSLEVFVIVISGDIQPQMQERVLSLGALDFIKKPVDSARLHGVLQRFGLY